MAENRRTVRVAIVDNSIEPAVYRPVDHWSRYLDVPWDAYVARKGEFPGARGHSHIILTGSEASILEREPWVDEEAEFVRRAVARGAAVLGSCWGHQLIAFALAGEAHVRRMTRPEIGWVPLRVDKANDLLGPAGTPFTFSIHYDEVVDLPPAFEVLASTETCPVQALKVTGKPVWGLQCHPEVDIPTGLKFLKDLLDRGFKGPEFLLEALRTAPRDSGLILRIVRTFLGSSPSM